MVLAIRYKLGGGFMSKDKMTTCKSCGHEISAKGKVTCPSCGRVNKKPFYKKTWFIVLVVLVVLGAIGGSGGTNDKISTPVKTATENVSEEKAVEEVKEPMVVSVDKLMEDLDSNALKASNTYKGQYVEITGKLAVIDSSGDYISLHPSTDFAIVGVQCYIKKEHLDQVMELEMNQNVTVIGTITDVGEILGYSLKVESIK